MVAIMQCLEREDEFLSWRSRHEDWDLGWEATRPANDWKSSHVTLLVSDPQGRAVVGHVARTVAGPRTGTFDRKVEVNRIHPVAPPLPLAELRGEFEKRYGGRRDVMDRHGYLPEQGGTAILNALVHLRPGLRGTVDELRQIDDRFELSGPRGKVLVEQRDATGLALQWAGLDRGAINQTVNLSDQLSGDTDPKYLDAMTAGSPGIEEQFISHDTTLFAGLQTLPTQDVAFRTFRDDDTRLVIGNINRDTLEHAYGVDLLYYHVTRRSFLLLQYKRMALEAGAWWYRPNAHLESQLGRMAELDKQCAKLHESDDDYRLSAAPSWFKLFQETALMPSGDDLCPGIYLERAHLEWLRKSQAAKGPQHGVRIGYGNVPRYLGTSGFTALVQDGWIGSTGTGSDHVVEQVKTSLRGERAVVFAALVEPDKPQSKRTADRRKGRHALERTRM